MMKIFHPFLWLLAFSSCSSLNTVPPTEIEGNWASACSGSAREASTFSGNVGYLSTTAFANPDCSTPNYVVLKTVNIKIGDYARSGERIFDYTQVSLTVTPKTSNGATTMNNVSLCGFTDWALDSTRDVTGKTCNSIPQAANGITTYSIYKLSTAVSPSTLQIGVSQGSATGISTPTRHSSLSSVRTKQ